MTRRAVDLGLLENKNFLTLLLTKEKTELSDDFNTFKDLILFLVKYAFILNDTTSYNNFLKREFPKHEELFFKNSNGARYLDPKYSRWLSTDPALSSYVEKNYNGPSGGIYNSVNLNLYHYGGNNPIKYVDPDGREVTLPAIWFDFGQSGFRTGAPQQYAGFGDWMDTAGKVLGFDLDAISIVTDTFTLRLWKGNYAGAAQLGEKIADIMGYKGVSTLLSFVGGSGGEIGFYNNDDKGLFGGSSMTPDQLSSIGLVSTEIQVINKNSRKVVGLRKESSPSFWTTVFNWFDRSNKEDLFTINKFVFDSSESASYFASQLEAAKENAIKYEHNRQQNYEVKPNCNTVIVIWGGD